MPKIKLSDSEVYYELHGNGDPIVLIGGLKADHSGWLPILGHLAKNNQVLIYDNRGAGQTVDSGNAFSVETMADDLMELIDNLNICNPHLVGHSLGGAVAQVFAKKYPDKISSITLSNTFSKFNNIGVAAFGETLKLHKANASQADIMSDIIPWVFSDNFINPAIIEFIRKSSNENPNPQLLCGYQRQYDALCGFDSRSWVSSISVPTLVIGSDLDKVATLSESEELALKICNAKLSVLNTGHASQVEKPDMFLDALLSFIMKIPSPSLSMK